MSTNNATHKKRVAMPSKIAPSKIYDYIKKIEIDGYPRVRAYAEAIDNSIYDLTPSQITDKLDYLQRNYKGYADIKASVLAEQNEWNLRKSGAIQNKAIDLLSNLLDKANEIATDPDADAKDLNVAVSTLKSILPAFAAMSNKQPQQVEVVDKKARASKFIN